MNKRNLAIFITILIVAASLILLYVITEKQKKIFIIGNDRYVIEHDKSWKEFSDNNTKNPAFYLTSFKFSDKKTVINLYKADGDTMKKWLEYIDSMKQEVDGLMIISKHGSATIDQYNSDIWFIGTKECCESSLETMIKLNDTGDFIFVQVVTDDESSSDKSFQEISKNFYQIIKSIHRL